MHWLVVQKKFFCQSFIWDLEIDIKIFLNCFFQTTTKSMQIWHVTSRNPRKSPRKCESFSSDGLAKGRRAWWHGGTACLFRSFRFSIKCRLYKKQQLKRFIPTCCKQRTKKMWSFNSWRRIRVVTYKRKSLDCWFLVKAFVSWITHKLPCFCASRFWETSWHPQCRYVCYLSYLITVHDQRLKNRAIHIYIYIYIYRVGLSSLEKIKVKRKSNQRLTKIKQQNNEKNQWIGWFHWPQDLLPPAAMDTDAFDEGQAGDKLVD